MVFTGPLEERLLIREKMSAYADTAFRGDAEAWLAHWIEDCIWIGPGFTIEGKAAMRRQWEALWARQDAMTFFTETGAIEVQGDHATARCYTLERLALKGGARQQFVGRYDDELVKQGGVWLFAKRTYQVHMAQL